MGGEVRMVPALPRAIRGEVLSRELWLEDFEPGRVSGFSSDNLPELAWACELWLWANRWRGAGGRASAGDPAAARLELEVLRGWGLARLELSRERFMFSEAFGRTYPGWHYMAKRAALALALELGWSDLAAALHGWRLAFLAYAATATGSRPGRFVSDHKLERLGEVAAGVVVADGAEVDWSGRWCAWSGDRADSRQGGDAAPEDFGRWWGWLGISSPSIWLELELGDRPAGSGSDEGEMLAALAERFPVLEGPGGAARLSDLEADALRRAREGDVAASLEVLEWCRGWRPEVPFRVRRTSREVLTVSPVGRGSSTPHAYAAGQERASGRVWALYADPGFRSHREPEPKWIGPGSAAVEELEGGALRIVARRSDGVFGPAEVVTLGGDVELDYSVGPGGLVVAVPAPVSPAAPAPSSPTPAPSSPRPRKRRGLAALLEALRRLFGGGR